MWGSKCRGCEAKDKEILHLIAQLDRLHAHLESSQARIAETVAPGIERRIAQKVPSARVNTPRAFIPSFPGYSREVARPTVAISEPGNE